MLRIWRVKSLSPNAGHYRCPRAPILPDAARTRTLEQPNDETPLRSCSSATAHASALLPLHNRVLRLRKNHQTNMRGMPPLCSSIPQIRATLQNDPHRLPCCRMPQLAFGKVQPIQNLTKSKPKNPFHNDTTTDPR